MGLEKDTNKNITATDMLPGRDKESIQIKNITATDIFVPDGTKKHTNENITATDMLSLTGRNKQIKILRLPICCP